MNDENLRPYNTLTEKEQRELVVKGGKASVEARRKKKMWKELVNIMLATPVKEANKIELEKYGIEGEDANLSAMILYRLIQKSMSGDLKAIEQLKEISGNKEVEKIDITSRSESAELMAQYLRECKNEKK